MNRNELNRLASWLRCYPVVGMESERESLTKVVEKELNESLCAVAHSVREHYRTGHGEQHLMEHFQLEQSELDSILRGEHQELPTYNDLRFQ